MTTQELVERLEAMANYEDAGEYHLAAKRLRAAADRLSEMEAENKRLEKERAYAVRWGEGAVESVKEVMWRYEDALKQINMHLSNHIETHKKVDVAVALAFETARAALEHQQQKGEGL